MGELVSPPQANIYVSPFSVMKWITRKHLTQQKPEANVVVVVVTSFAYENANILFIVLLYNAVKLRVGEAYLFYLGPGGNY